MTLLFYIVPMNICYIHLQLTGSEPLTYSKCIRNDGLTELIKLPIEGDLPFLLCLNFMVISFSTRFHVFAIYTFDTTYNHMIYESI